VSRLTGPDVDDALAFEVDGRRSAAAVVRNLLAQYRCDRLEASVVVTMDWDVVARHVSDQEISHENP
jgi:hypothetical protein